MNQRAQLICLRPVCISNPGGFFNLRADCLNLGSPLIPLLFGETLPPLVDEGFDAFSVFLYRGQPVFDPCTLLCCHAHRCQLLDLLTSFHHRLVRRSEVCEVLRCLLRDLEGLWFGQHEGTHQVIKIAERFSRLRSVQQVQSTGIGDPHRSAQRQTELRMISTDVQGIAVCLLRLTNRQVLLCQILKLCQIGSPREQNVKIRDFLARIGVSGQKHQPASGYGLPCPIAIA